MNENPQPSNKPFSETVVDWLQQPLSSQRCFIGWLCALVVFIGVTAILGGPTQGDVAISAYSSWAIANGDFACAYPHLHHFVGPSIADPYTLIAPFYSTFSGGLLAVTRLANFAGFPTGAQLGPHCSTAIAAMFKWSMNSNAIVPTVHLGYLSFVALTAGVIAVLRAAGLGRKNWEPVTLLIVAILPPVIECLTEYFHPQDLFALAFALGSIACMMRGRWAWTGVLMALAFTSNQFVLLIAVPMIILVPSNRRIRTLVAGAATVLVVLVPIIVLTSGRALRYALIGSTFTRVQPQQDPWLSETHGALLVIVTRVPPLALAILLAWWAQRRLGPRVMDPVPLLSIFATTLTLRLVFEPRVLGYYFAAAAVMLLLLEAARGRIRGASIAWMVVLILAINPVPFGFVENPVTWGLKAHELMPTIVFLVLTAVVVTDLFRRRFRWYVVAALIVVGLTAVDWPWNHETLRHAMPLWFWQVLLVPTLLWLTISPLLSTLSETHSLTSNASQVQSDTGEA